MGKKNPNMRTRAWGPPAWFVLIMVAMGYPCTRPTSRQRAEYRRFFKSFGDVMPCSLCRDSYKLFLKEIPMDNNVMSSRRNLVYWVFDIKNLVNEKLGCKQLQGPGYRTKYNEYDTYRATSCSKNKLGCTEASSGIRRPKRIKLVPVSDKKAKK